jgi:hypothetical protein
VRRLLISIVLFFVALALVGLVAIGWIFSNSILRVEPYSLQSEFEILGATLITVTLPEPPNDNQFADTRRKGTYNLRWGNVNIATPKVDGPSSTALNYGRLGKIISDSDGKIVRELSITAGEAPKARVLRLPPKPKR